VPRWNNSEKSISFLRQAVETDPTFWVARVRLGLMLATEGYMDEAHTELLRAYRDSEGDAYAKSALDQVQR